MALVLLLASTGALVLAQHNAKAPAAVAPALVRDSELKDLIASLGYSGLDVSVRSDGNLLVTGYVERNEDMDDLRTALVQHGFNPVVEAKSGPRIADEVAENVPHEQSAREHEVGTAKGMCWSAVTSATRRS